MQGFANLAYFAFQFVDTWRCLIVLIFFKLFPQCLSQFIELFFQSHHAGQFLFVGHLDQEQDIVFKVSNHLVINISVCRWRFQYCLSGLEDFFLNVIEGIYLILSDMCQSAGNIFKEVEVRLRELIDCFPPVVDALRNCYYFDQLIRAGSE